MKTNSSNSIIGKPLDRIDGILKVTGQARYTADTKQQKLAYAVLVQSTIGSGTITELKLAAAEKVPGVLAIITHNNAPKVQKPKTSNPLLLLQDNIIRHAGQNIAVVVADSLQAATLAAQLVEVAYKETPSKTDLASAQAPAKQEDKDYVRGDLAAGLAQGKISIQQQYTTPTEFHNPMEPFATVASWENDRLTLYDTTQGVFPTRKTVAETLGIPVEKVQVITHYLGGGFGCKLVVWSHVILAAMASKEVNRPVKLVVQRRQMFGPVGFRPMTIQKLTLAASREGRLTAIEHTSVSETSVFNQFVESVDEPTKVMYACPNMRTSVKTAALNIGAPIWMRAPGDAPGSFALESAIDELAEKLELDPVELRLLNFAKVHPESKLPWSSNSLKECYSRGAEKINWSARKAKPRQVLDGKYLIGTGMAAATHGTYRSTASAIVEIFANGHVTIKAGTQDIGTGTYTIMAQITADVLQVPPETVTVELGDTNLPPTPLSGGSMTAATVGSAVHDVCMAVLNKLKTMATTDKKSPLFGVAAHDIEASGGGLVTSGGSASISYRDLIKSSGQPVVSAQVESKPTPEAEAYAKQSFGAQFAKVRVDSELGTIKVEHLVGVYGAGRILNAKTARSQMIGGLIFALSMALFEEAIFDHQLGRLINGDLEQYHLPVHADMPEFDVSFVEEHDPHINSIGAKGIGELCITGAAAAIANAVYNATGIRVRDLPISLDKLL